MRDWARWQFTLPFFNLLFSYIIIISQSRFPAGRIPGSSEVDDRPVSIYVSEDTGNQSGILFLFLQSKPFDRFNPFLDKNNPQMYDIVLEINDNS